MKGALPGWRWLAWPVGLTLAVTSVRLLGELRGWSPRWFGTAAGGGGAIVGIGWLIPVFGWWFGRQLVALGRHPRSTRRASFELGLGVASVALAFTVVELVLGVTYSGMLVGMLGCVIGGVLASRAWPELGRCMFAYAIGARLPIAVITGVAVANDWGTHYEKLAVGAPEMSSFGRFSILVLAQAGFWIPITLIGGAMAGLTALATPRRFRAG